MSLCSKPLTSIRPLHIFVLLIDALRRVGGLSSPQHAQKTGARWGPRPQRGNARWCCNPPAAESQAGAHKRAGAIISRMPSQEKSAALARSMIGAALWLSLACLPIVQAQEEPGKQIPMAQAVEHALQQSQLTLPGNKPFHLKAHIAAIDNTKTEYTADVDEYWAGPQKWRRIVTAKEFSQTLIVNGESVAEKVTGDYYPFWLHDLVTAIFDPLPMAEQLKRMNTQVEIPEDSTKSQSCVSMQSKVGAAPAQNTLAYAFCFGGKLGLIEAAITPGYKAQFADYLPFKNQLVARTITADFAPGLAITAKITDLTEMANPEESMFAIDAPTPLAQQIRSSQIGEESARILAVSTPAIVWPAVREGSTSGVLSVYISTDRSGQVREVWPLGFAPARATPTRAGGPGSGNPALNDAAREQVLRWQYKPFMNGGPTQMEAVRSEE